MCCVANLWGGGGWVGVGCRPCQPRPLENRLGFIQTSQRETDGDAAFFPPPLFATIGLKSGGQTGAAATPTILCAVTVTQKLFNSTGQSFGDVDLSTVLLLLQLLIIRIFTLYGTKKTPHMVLLLHTVML